MNRPPVAPCLRLHRAGGFSLVEILIALAVIVPIVVVAAGILPFFRFTSDRAWTLSCAADIAHEQMERARGTAFDTVASIGAQTETRNGTDYTYTLDVTPLETPAQRKRVVVTVTWNNPQSQRVAFETLLARTTLTSASPSASPSATPASTPASSPSNNGNGNGNGNNGANGNSGGKGK